MKFPKGSGLALFYSAYRKIPKISPGAYTCIFQRSFLRGLIFGGAYVRREIWVSKVIGQAYSRKEILPFLFCFVLYLGAISKCKPPAVIFGGAIKRRVFCVTSLGGLYLDGLIHGGAYFRNFTVFMNDLVYVIKRSNLSTYADDTQILFDDKGPWIVQET